MATRSRLYIPIYATASFISIFAVYSSIASAHARRSQDPCKVALSNKQGTVQLPKIKPIIPRTRKKTFDDARFQFEMKYDGYRGLAYFERGRSCRFVSRSGKRLTQFQPLCEAIAAELNVQNAIFDGEVISYDPTGRPVFNNIQRRKKPFRYVAFDLLWINNHDLRSLPLEQRRQLLLEVLPNDSSLIAESLVIIGNGSRIFQLMVENDLEGIVAKRLMDPYLRTTRWYKIKNESYSQSVGRGKFFR